MNYKYFDNTLQRSLSRYQKPNPFYLFPKEHIPFHDLNNVRPYLFADDI